MPVPAAATLPADALVLGRYRPLRPLGTGGSGSVWLARDERSGLDVALKIVPREGKAADRARREAEAAARLRHERCLRAYALAHDAGNVYIAYEYVPGRTLREAMRAGDLDDHAAVEAAAQIADGLAHAHARGIVHRDVKPANVLLAEGERVSVRILDFGLAQMEEAETLTAMGDVPGTLAYISPERLRGEEGTPAADVWAVGVLLWEALAGGHPFWKPSLLESARAIEAGAPPLGSLRPDLPQPLAAAVDRALSLDPARRPSARELADLLRRTERKPRERRTLPLSQLAASSLAAVTVGGSTAALPFFPAPLAAALAVAAAVASFARPRLGLAIALAAPILPFGNLSLGLALAYALAAAAWLAVFAREPRFALLPALGPLLGPLTALGLVPLLVQKLQSPLRRALAAAATVVLAAPPALDRIGIAGSAEPDAVAGALARALPSDRPLLAGGLAAAAVALAYARTPWHVAIWGAGTLAAALLLAPGLPALPVIAAVWGTCGLKAWR